VFGTIFIKDFENINKKIIFFKKNFFFPSLKNKYENEPKAFESRSDSNHF